MGFFRSSNKQENNSVNTDWNVYLSCAFDDFYKGFIYGELKHFVNDALAIYKIESGIDVYDANIKSKDLSSYYENTLSISNVDYGNGKEYVQLSVQFNGFDLCDNVNSDSDIAIKDVNINIQGVEK